MLFGEITNQFNDGPDMGIMATITLTFNHIITVLGEENSFASKRFDSKTDFLHNAIKGRSQDACSSHIFLAHEKFISLLLQALFFYDKCA